MRYLVPRALNTERADGALEGIPAHLPVVRVKIEGGHPTVDIAIEGSVEDKIAVVVVEECAVSIVVLETLDGAVGEVDAAVLVVAAATRCVRYLNDSYTGAVAVIGGAVLAFVRLEADDGDQCWGSR